MNTIHTIEGDVILEDLAKRMSVRLSWLENGILLVRPETSIEAKLIADYCKVLRLANGARYELFQRDENGGVVQCRPKLIEEK